MTQINQFTRFCLVGGSGFVIDALLFFTLVHGAQTPWLSARILAFVGAVAVTWAGNRRFTFASQAGPAAESARYLLTQSGGCGVNYLSFVIAVQLLGSGGFLILPYLLGTAAGLSFNYALSRAWVFRPA